MSRAYLIIVILHLALIFQGCAPLEYLDGSSEEETRKFKMTKDEMWNEIEELKAENLDLQGQANTLKEENQRIRDENESNMPSMRDQNEVLNEQVNRLKEEKQRITDDNQLLAKRLAELQLKHETLASGSYELEKDIGKLKIKVLSGDGNLNSAKEMAKKLKNMAYQIELIGYAPRSNFFRNTVFFAPKFENEAKRLVLSLGGNAITKPLTWSSIFDLIVVTGKSP